MLIRVCTLHVCTSLRLMLSGTMFVNRYIRVCVCGSIAVESPVEGRKRVKGIIAWPLASVYVFFATYFEY